MISDDRLKRLNTLARFALDPEFGDGIRLRVNSEELLMLTDELIAHRSSKVQQSSGLFYPTWNSELPEGIQRLSNEQRLALAMAISLASPTTSTPLEGTEYVVKDSEGYWLLTPKARAEYNELTKRGYTIYTDGTVISYDMARVMNITSRKVNSWTGPKSRS